MRACHCTMLGIHGCAEGPSFLKIILEAKNLCLPSFCAAGIKPSGCIIRSWSVGSGTSTNPVDCLDCLCESLHWTDEVTKRQLGHFQPAIQRVVVQHTCGTCPIP